MSQAGRIVVAAFGIMGCAIVGVLYAQAGQPLITMLQNDYSGPFSSLAGQLNTVVPLLLGAIILGLVAWVIVGPVQEERARRRRYP
jgi:mannose/fructose/N-acetylgalactosamine-specific phosphotransferase system component IID